MNDVLAARIRTYWPIFVGHVAAFLVVVVLRLTGIRIESAFAVELVSLALSGLVWELGRWLEDQTDTHLQAAGRWLVSMGRTIGAPTYQQLPPGPSTIDGDVVPPRS